MSSVDSLFSSQERMAVLRFLLFRSHQYFTESELADAVGRKALVAGRTLQDLEKLGAIKKLRNSDTGEYVFRANKHWMLYDEFRALFVKAQLLIENDLERKLPRLGSIRLFVLTGMFVGDQGAPTDMLIVGKVNTRALSALIANFEQEIGQEVNYTVLTYPEFEFRQNVGDRFLHGIIDNRHVVIADYLETPPPTPSDPLPPSMKLPVVEKRKPEPKPAPKVTRRIAKPKKAIKATPKKRIIKQKKTTRTIKRKRR